MEKKGHGVVDLRNALRPSQIHPHDGISRHGAQNIYVEEPIRPKGVLPVVLWVAFTGDAHGDSAYGKPVAGKEPAGQIFDH